MTDDDEERDEAAEAREGTWNLANAPYTIEGELEGFQRFGTGVRKSGGWQRTVGLFLVVLLLAPIVYSVLHVLASVLL
ncbi:MAG TPA: hypothetical protein VNB24_04800 [Acidimicrobiales bacterium]|nr:hypothetical protein [Acidimicrobiales bacterium]